MKTIALLVIVVMALAYPMGVKAADRWITYYPGDPNLVALTANTQNILDQSPDVLIQLRGVAPNSGDGWKIQATTDAFYVHFLASSQPGKKWGEMSLYLDGKLIENVEQVSCDSVNCWDESLTSRNYSGLIYGPHTFEIVNSGAHGLPINITNVQFGEYPLNTKYQYLPIMMVN